MRKHENTVKFRERKEKALLYQVNDLQKFKERKHTIASVLCNYILIFVVVWCIFFLITTQLARRFCNWSPLVAYEDLMLLPYKQIAEHLLTSLMQNLILSKIFVISLFAR